MGSSSSKRYVGSSTRSWAPAQAKDKSVPAQDHGFQLKQKISRFQRKIMGSSSSKRYVGSSTRSWVPAQAIDTSVPAQDHGFQLKQKVPAQDHGFQLKQKISRFQHKIMGSSQSKSVPVQGKKKLVKASLLFLPCVTLGSADIMDECRVLLQLSQFIVPSLEDNGVKMGKTAWLREEQCRVLMQWASLSFLLWKTMVLHWG